MFLPRIALRLRVRPWPDECRFALTVDRIENIMGTSVHFLSLDFSYRSYTERLPRTEQFLAICDFRQGYVAQPHWNHLGTRVFLACSFRQALDGENAFDTICGRCDNWAHAPNGRDAARTVNRN